MAGEQVEEPINGKPLDKVAKDDIDLALRDVYGSDIEIIHARSPYNRDKLVQIHWKEGDRHVQIEYRGREYSDLAIAIALAYYRVKKGIMLDFESRGLIHRKEKSDAESTGEKAGEGSGS